MKKALVESTPRGYSRTRPAACPKLGAHTARIEQNLADDQVAPKKQRHTAHRIFQRLRDEHGYVGGYDQVRQYVSAHRKRERETHLLLDHPPGCRLECDFGHSQVDFPEGRRQVPVLIGIWSYSHYPFAIAISNCYSSTNFRTTGGLVGLSSDGTTGQLFADDHSDHHSS